MTEQRTPSTGDDRQPLPPLVECVVSRCPVMIEGHWVSYAELVAFARSTSVGGDLHLDAVAFIAWKRANAWAPFALDVTFEIPR